MIKYITPTRKIKNNLKREEYQYSANNNFKLTRLWHGYVPARCARQHKPRHERLAA